jgi:hypothetical protein
VVLNRFWLWCGVGVGDYFFAVLLGFFVALIFLLLHLSQADMLLSDFVQRNLLSAVIIGTLLWVNNFLLFVSIIIVTEIIWWFLLQKIVVCKFLPDSAYLHSDLTSVGSRENRENSKTPTAEFCSELVWDNSKTQQIIRSKTESGVEKLVCYFLVEFVEGQLAASVHVPFYPSFDKLPEVEAYLVDVLDVKLTVAKTQHFGTRIDIKRVSKSADKLRLVVIVLGT